MNVKTTKKRPSKKRTTKKAVTAPVTKPSAGKKVDATPAKEVTTPHHLPGAVKLLRSSMALLWHNKVLFGGILVIYALLNIVFVTGLGGSIDIAAVRNEYSSKIVGGLAAYTELLGSAGSGASEGAGVYQLVFFVIASLAIIWALRQVYAGEAVRIRDAFYKGMYPLVPNALILLVIGLQLLPMIIGSTMYQLVIVNGIAATPVEVGLWSLAALSLSLLSVYFIASSIFGYYISTLPDMTPIKALRSARQLVKGRRWKVLRKLLFLPFVLLVTTLILFLPVILVAPVAAQVLQLLLSPLLIAIAHSYLYSLYRELMHV